MIGNDSFGEKWRAGRRTRRNERKRFRMHFCICQTIVSETPTRIGRHISQTFLPILWRQYCRWPYGMPSVSNGLDHYKTNHQRASHCRLIVQTPAHEPLSAATRATHGTERLLVLWLLHLRCSKCCHLSCHRAVIVLTRFSATVRPNATLATCTRYASVVCICVPHNLRKWSTIEAIETVPRYCLRWH